MWALICSAAPSVCSQEISFNDSIAEDSTGYVSSYGLIDEVVVTASPVADKTDGKIIRPSAELLRTSSDGIDLLRKLQLPRLIVNPLTGGIDISGGGEVRLCINGVESTADQIRAIPPHDIIKIEYHDKPGIRHSGADIVIDYITVRHDSGGNVFLNSFGAFGKGRWASIDNFAAQYNQGRSVWSLNAGYFGKRSDNWSRDYDETWNYPDASISRREYGLPVPVSNHILESSLNYNYMHPSGNVFNVRLGFNVDDVPYKEEGDRLALLLTSGDAEPVLVMEHTEEHSLRPDIGLYYRHKLSESRSFLLEAQGSYMRSHMKHEYYENGTGSASRVNGDRYAVRFLGMYGFRQGSHACDIGVSYDGSFLRNAYFSDSQVNRIRPKSADFIKAFLVANFAIKNAMF
ncbi:MAG: hypothetical protein K2L59_02750, partial [Muribaculaceae bacterium]|nr:hypothetical protein [Muribaculaceae bacterium]